MSNDPDQIRAEIEATRAGLSSNVNALTESVKPGNVVRRQMGGTFSSLKDQVMGSDDTTGKAASARDSVVESATSGTSAAAQKTRGNPLAAGVIAFGAGLLLGSLLPTSEAEQQAAAAVKDKAQPLTDQVTDAAKSVAADLKEPVTQAAQNLKAAATDAATTVKDEAHSTASGVKSSTADAADKVKNAD